MNEQSNERGCFGMMIGLLLIWIIIALVIYVGYGEAIAHLFGDTTAWFARVLHVSR